MKMPCLQIRAVSNYVGDRDKSRWDIDGALKNLNVVLSELF
jgi:futalosine hydrolase